MSDSTLAHLLETRRVVLCVGCGGVGKTTVAASLALAAAQRGARVLCMTIDPAKRLANSLGLEQMTHEQVDVAPALLRAAGLEVSGRLTVMMLDTKRTFDELVQRYASSPAARDRILDNRLYQYVSTSLAGTQEYMAMEKLLGVLAEGAYDLVVLDTPPTSNALDFLDAPSRMVAALDSGAMRWFIQAFQSTGKLSFNLVTKSVSVILRGIGKLTGGGFLEQLAQFITELDDLFGGFKERATAVAAAFRSPDFGYVLVTSPEPSALREVQFFAQRLEEQGMRPDACVVNRVHQRPAARPSLPEIEQELSRAGLQLGPEAAPRLQQALEEELVLAGRDEQRLAELGPPLGRLPRTLIPALAADVHDLQALAGIAARLVAPGAARAAASS